MVYLICIVMALAAWHCHRQELADLKQGIQGHQQRRLMMGDMP